MTCYCLCSKFLAKSHVTVCVLKLWFSAYGLWTTWGFFYAVICLILTTTEFTWLQQTQSKFLIPFCKCVKLLSSNFTHYITEVNFLEHSWESVDRKFWDFELKIKFVEGLYNHMYVSVYFSSPPTLASAGMLPDNLFRFLLMACCTVLLPVVLCCHTSYHTFCFCFNLWQYWRKSGNIECLHIWPRNSQFVFSDKNESFIRNFDSESVQGACEYCFS